MSASTTVLRTFANELEAQLAQAVLDAHGIPSAVVRDDAGGAMPWLQLLHPVRLVVRGEDAVEAARLLDEDVEAAE
jgi:Putative prokaryotic signal transducing protein